MCCPGKWEWGFVSHLFCCNVPESFSNPNPMWFPLRKLHARKVPSSQLIHVASGKERKKNLFEEKDGISKPYLGPA